MWKQIRNYNYEINENGLIRNIKTGKFRKGFKRKDGYVGVQLYLGKVVNFQLHRLIAEAFIPNPENKLYVNHKNSNRSDNSLDNLEWVTFEENVKHAYESGYASNKGSNNGFSVLSEEQVLEMRSKRKNDKLTYQELATHYNVSYGCVAGIIQRKTWKHI